MFPFTVLSHPTSDIKHPTLLLHTSQGTRYLFGKVPEGLQRSLNEQKKRVSKVQGIFLTGKLDWESIGGLPGLILTISDQGKKDLSLYYGDNFISYVISTWRSFVFRFGMKLGVNVVSHGETFKDGIMSVQTVNLKGSTMTTNSSLTETISKHLKTLVSQMFPLDVKNTYTEEENEEEENYESENYDSEAEQSDPRLSNSYIHVKLPEVKRAEVSTCYIIQLNKLRGKFLAEKAVELGIPKGKLRGQLASGKEITLENGTVIKPEQVLSEERHFQKILLIDIPSKEYLKSAEEYQWGNDVGIVYHFLGEDIEPFEPKYLEFIKSFGDNVHHYISHPLYSPDSIVFKSHSDMTLKLKILHANHFNLPKSSKAIRPLPDLSNNNVNINLLAQGQIASIECTPKMQNNIIKLDESDVNLLTGDHWENKYEENISTLNSNYTKDQILNSECVSSKTVNPDLPLEDQVETITLGTGSALPSKYRNVVSTLIRVPYKSLEGELSYRSVLLDAGENTIGSLRRSLESLDQYFKELKLIYLSHLHADHHLGIITIIKEWLKQNKENDSKLYLVTPWQYNRFVNEWIKFEDENALDRLIYISCEDFLYGRVRNELGQISFEEFSADSTIRPSQVKHRKNQEEVDNLFNDVGINKFLTCRAIHCAWAYSCSIVFKLQSEDYNNFKVSYSGDTRPNYFMFSEKVGRDSDLLIHEATLENELIEEAKKKRHSTMNEAIEVSNSMRARKLILTHFSQRYPHLPKISNHIKVNAPYCVAFDLMVNKYSSIGDQLEIMDQLNTIFSPEKFENELNAEEESTS